MATHCTQKFYHACWNYREPVTIEEGRVLWQGMFSMRFSLRGLFGLLTVIAALLSICSYAFRTDEYQRAEAAAVLFVSTGEAEETAEKWLAARQFRWARVPADLQDNYWTCGTGRTDSWQVQCLTTFRADTVKGLPIYASLCIAPVDDNHSIVRIEFEARFRTSQFYRARLAHGRDLIWQLREDANRWLKSEARSSGAPDPEIALHCARFKPGTAHGTQFELEKHLAEYFAQAR
jgi:hypothetical protein